MSQRILGLDLGTNSIGLSLRDVDNYNQLKDQLVYFSSCVFRSGVGKNERKQEYSYAAERTEYRQSRRKHQSRHQRLWATLQLLIDNNFCPLAKESLERWQKCKKGEYDHQYPIDDIPFNNWIKLDFDGDGKPEYHNPYQLRMELAELQFDFTKQIDRYKLGRALYHIAQRRGFKSSKGKTLSQKDEEAGSDVDIVSLMKDSEAKECSKLTAYMEKNLLKTPGQAFTKLITEGVRVRGGQYHVVRSQLKEEITYIFEFQHQLSTGSEFYKCLVSEKKGEGTIFYKRPLRSQKFLVGKCKFEPNKYRCSLSHPEYEKFKAWSFINNIKVRSKSSDNLEPLSLSLRQKIYHKSFISKVRDYFSFKEIRLEIQKELGGIILNNNQNKSLQTINYADNYSVDGCPVTVRLINLLGDDWQHVSLKSDKERQGHSTAMHQVFYSAMDLWNICFDTDNPSDIISFAKERLGWDENDKRTKNLVSLWAAISKHSQYGMLSLKALRNINNMLLKGFKYSDAVMLAKIPDIIALSEKQMDDLAQCFESNILSRANYQRKVARITNKLIASYKSLNLEYRFADHNISYVLQESDRTDIVKCINDELGEKEYDALSDIERDKLKEEIAESYQQFFNSTSRDFMKVPTIKEMWAEYLHKKFPNVPESKWNKLYHPSQMNIFHQNNEGKLGSPNLGAIKNPVALRTLQVLRSKINSLIDDGLISPDDTKIVVETAREMNDANMRWALNEWNKQRENENKEIKKLLSELNQEADMSNSEKFRYALEQSDFDKYDDSKKNYKVDVSKYRLWREQEFRCMYTGKIISLSKLFDGHSFNIEHTLPLSQSLDNSDSNRTICDAYYNQHIKGKRLPSDLPNYEYEQTIDGEVYTAIKSRLVKWEVRLKHLQEKVSYWRWRARHAQTKDSKDFCIRQMHLWNFDAEYWRKKVETFKVTEFKDGFRHSQLVDTRIITRYATLYLKSLFSNVDVQKGEVTSVFRKILGLQAAEQAKDRSNYAHHAIDATMLTLMPVPAKRERMLRLFYQIEEKKKAGLDTQYESNELKIEIAGLHIGKDVHEIADYIKSNILVEHSKRRDALAPSTHVILKASKGKKHKELYTEKSVIRGQLHEQTFLGAIRQWKKNADGTVVKDNHGKPVIDQEKITFVSREPLQYKANEKDPGFKNWDDLLKKIVNKDLVSMMKGQFEEGTSFREACERGIYMLDKKGNKVNRIRTVRIDRRVTKKSAKMVKPQVYKSTKDYKNYYYAKVGRIYAGCEYSNGKQTIFKIYSLMDIANNRQSHQEEIPCSCIGTKGNVLKLKRKFKAGDTVLLYEHTANELRELNNEELGKRLYVIHAFESDGRIILVRSSFAGKPTQGKTIEKFSELPDVIRIVMRKMKCLQEGKEFTLGSGKISFNPNL